MVLSFSLQQNVWLCHEDSLVASRSAMSVALDSFRYWSQLKHSSTCARESCLLTTYPFNRDDFSGPALRHGSLNLTSAFPSKLVVMLKSAFRRGMGAAARSC